MSVQSAQFLEAFEPAHDSIPLGPAPIAPDTIIEGKPVARAAILARSPDRLSETVAWDCTAGRFYWHYSIDETVHIVEGEVHVAVGNQPTVTLRPGDVALFPAGSSAIWHVEKYVRKVAFCRTALPTIVALQVRILRKAKRVLSRLRSGRRATSGFGTD